MSAGLFSALDELSFVLDLDHAIAVIDFRKVTIKKPLTAFGAKLLAKQLSAWPSPNEAAEIMIEKCWRGFKPQWVKEQQQYGKARGLDHFAAAIEGEENGAHRQVNGASHDRNYAGGVPGIGFRSH